MNKKIARQIAETITNQELAEMFSNAKSGIQDWTARSSANKTMTKGTAWNILAAKFDIEHKYHILAKKNMVWEFGDFLPPRLLPKKPEKKDLPTPVHQEPKF